MSVRSLGHYPDFGNGLALLVCSHISIAEAPNINSRVTPVKPQARTIAISSSNVARSARPQGKLDSASEDTELHEGKV